MKKKYKLDSRYPKNDIGQIISEDFLPILDDLGYEYDFKKRAGYEAFIIIEGVEIRCKLSEGNRIYKSNLKIYIGSKNKVYFKLGGNVTGREVKNFIDKLVEQMEKFEQRENEKKRNIEKARKIIELIKDKIAKLGSGNKLYINCSYHTSTCYAVIIRSDYGYSFILDSETLKIKSIEIVQKNLKNKKEVMQHAHALFRMNKLITEIESITKKIKI